MTTNNNYFCRFNTTTDPVLLNDVDNDNDFIGSYESTDKFNGLYVNCISDVKLLLYVDFSENGSDTDITKTHEITPNKHFHVVEQNHGRYFRVRLHNDDSDDATITRLTTRLTEIDRATTHQKFGHHNNIFANGYFAAGEHSQSVDVSRWRTAQIFYTDESYATPCDLTVQLSNDGTNYHDAAMLERTLTATHGVANMIIRLDGINYLRLYNQNSMESPSTVNCSVYGSN